MQKTSVQNSNVELPTTNCLRSTTNYLSSTSNGMRSGDLTDMARLLRKEENITKGLRTVLGVNQSLEKSIKAHECGIGDERAGLAYQLAQLMREMKLKFHYFVQERLERRRLQNMETAKHTLQQMTERYHKVEEESNILQCILEQMESMAMCYSKHSNELQEELLGIETASQQHEQAMRSAIVQKASEAARKVTEHEASDTHIKQLIAEIDSFVQQASLMKAAHVQATNRVEKLRRIAKNRQEQADAMALWQGYVVDWSSREMFVRKIAQQENVLRRVRERNERLQLFLEELQREETVLQALKSTKRTSRQQKPPR